MTRYITSIDGCARCGKYHRSVVCNTFTNVIEDPGGDFTHWTMCPVTHEPLLLRRMPSTLPLTTRFA